MYITKFKGPAREAVEKLQRELIKRATTALNLPESEITLRELLPIDLDSSIGEATWDFATGGTGWVTFIDDATIASDRFCCIYGLVKPTEYVDQIRVSRAGRTSRIWPVEFVPHLYEDMIFFTDPIMVDQNQKIKIEGYSASSATETWTFLGLVAERKGLKQSS